MIFISNNHFEVYNGVLSSLITTCRIYPQFISRSSPAICVNNVGRSDTFVLDESQTATDMKQFNDPFAKVEVTNATVRLINEARVFAINIVETLDELKKV